jgi:hypothetical protein
VVHQTILRYREKERTSRQAFDESLGLEGEATGFRLNLA